MRVLLQVYRKVAEFAGSALPDYAGNEGQEQLGFRQEFLLSGDPLQTPRKSHDLRRIFHRPQFFQRLQDDGV